MYNQRITGHIYLANIPSIVRKSLGIPVSTESFIPMHYVHAARIES